MSNRYQIGVLWSLSACLIGAFNDLACKLSGSDLPGFNVLFFRFLFTALFFVPFIIINPKKYTTKHFWVHGVRGGLFALAMVPWGFSVISLPLPTVTTIGFTTPIFITLLAGIFLKERLGWQRLLATGMGFVGIMVSAQFTLTGSVNIMAGLAILATLLFAVLDIVNKRLLILNEGIQSLMFYSALWTTLWTLPFALYYWKTPSMTELGLLALLGLGGNCLLGCILKSLSYCEVSSLQPLRYIEFIFSSVLSVLVFQKWPTGSDIAGIMIIIPCTLYLVHHEFRLNRASKKSAV
jgi:S-adenosylmethionine uptake transporter